MCIAGISLAMYIIQGVVIVRKRKGSFCSSSFWWRSELLHVETGMCYEPLRE